MRRRDGRLTLRFVDRARLKVQLQVEPRDLWVGAFWRWGQWVGLEWHSLKRLRIFHLYLCLVPCVPLHVTMVIAATRRCRVCGCTGSDCRGCIERTGSACWWVGDDLCSACAPVPAGVGGEVAP